MKQKPQCLILDTNVIMDLYLPDRHSHATSSKAIDLARSCEIPLLYTTAQAADAFFLIGQALKKEARLEQGSLSQTAARSINAVCWGILENLADNASVVGADESDAWLARKYRKVHGDFEDNLVIAAAERSKADFIVTNDEELMKHAPVATITPAGLLALLEAFDDLADTGN